MSKYPNKMGCDRMEVGEEMVLAFEQARRESEWPTLGTISPDGGGEQQKNRDKSHANGVRAR
jgi:hypothetical protein